ncbi:2-dehydro-3-deoxyglucarate aldolase [Rhodovulum sp. ES.010]|uniref:HpcH/HpaI aldolase family protein n=1 Tax=Rhodovulum sp. ES.010 TaxID=1882821 RepID=UPI000929A70F|nr:aldolase/citrate lyase family protein [Rhodovulum sp. ES.010]SIO03279.1 2-dehydro-3-deoxyglucarate aldolase [Rhodovulum sp. ES.010]
MVRADLVAALRQRLSGGGVSVGSWMQFGDSDVAEVMGRAGYDWVAVDLEHGSIAHDRLPDMFRALELGGTLPMVRLPESTPLECKRALDAGAAGVIAPTISTAEEARAVVDACRWPPAGTRGVGFSRANLFGTDFEAYRAFAQAPFVAVMIETRAGVQNLPGILAVEGIDALLIGPYDLSASLGQTGAFDTPKFTAALARIREVAGQAGVPAGLHVVDLSPEALHARIAEGYRFLAYSIDSVALRSAIANPLAAEAQDGDAR